MICVYPADCTDFSTNGLGLVEPQSCTVTKTLNGEYELTLVHPIDENGKWTRLLEGNILRAPVPAACTPQVRLVTQSGGYAVYRITTQSDPLRLRSGAGTQHTIVGQYRKGSYVIVLAQPASGWYEVSCPDGKHGYMASEYLTFDHTEGYDVSPMDRVIAPRQLRDQPFRIYRIVPELTQITVYARHIFYDLLDNMIQNLAPSSAAIGAAVVQRFSDECLAYHGFTFYSDLTTTAEDLKIENMNPVEGLLGEGGLVEKYGAELARDWFDVFLVRRVGSDTDVQVREGKNLLGISYDVDETSVVTRIMPTGEDEDGNILYLDELFIDSPNIGAYPHPKWYHLTVPEAKASEGMSRTQAQWKLREAAQAEFANGCDLPTITLAVDFVNCVDTEEYRQYGFLQNIFLGDAVRVIARRVGVEVSMRMTQYTYDCLTKKYRSVTLGTVADTLEGNMISIRQLAAGSITGTKLAIHSVGSGQLQSGSVGALQVKAAAIGSAHIQTAAIARAHIAEALIDTLNVNALTAVTAKIQELAAGNITTETLYASIAAIAAAQITTANIVSANIRWADIESLAAEAASISRAQITTANIAGANIDWAAISTLTAAFAAIARTEIGSADIGWAHVKDLVTDTAIITQGVGGELYIARLAVTEANLVSLTVGELVVKGQDGHFYSVSVDEVGNVVSTLKQVGNDDLVDLSIHAGEKIIEGSVTAACLNAQNIFAESAIIRSLIAANLDVDTLFAREATIAALNAADIRGNAYLSLMVGSKADRSELEALEGRLSAAELRITEDAIVSTVTGSETYQADLEELNNRMTAGDVAVSSTAPQSPATNSLWLDASVSPNILKRWDGTAWTACGAEADLSQYYTRTETDTRFEQTEEAIALKANTTVTDALNGRISTAEGAITANSEQLALKVSSSAYDVEKVHRGTTAPLSPAEDMLWLDTSASPNLLKRYTGGEWLAAGAEEVKASGLYIGSNAVRIQTEEFLLQLLDPSDNENILMEMSAQGHVGFRALYADAVISDSVASAYGGPSFLQVAPAFSGTSAVYFRSLGEAVKAVNQKYLTGNVFIFLPNGYANLYETEGVQIRGIVGAGVLTIVGNAACTLNSYIAVTGCSARIVFESLKLREIRQLNGTNRNAYLVECHMNHFVEFSNCTLDANDTTYDSVYSDSSHVFLYNTGLYNALQGLEVYLGTGAVKNCRGSCAWAMIVYAGILFANGTVPSGSRASGENGQLFDNGVTVDYGTAIPVVVPDSTVTLVATTTRTWQGGWRTDTLDAVQGVYSDLGYQSSLEWNHGCMWFGSLASALSGTTVKSATLTLHRKTGSGPGGAAEVYLCAITNGSASGPPIIAMNYGALGAIGRNSQMTYSIPVAAVQGLADGAYGGLCLYEPPNYFGSSAYSPCYMRISGTDTGQVPHLTVVHSGR